MQSINEYFGNIISYMYITIATNKIKKDTPFLLLAAYKWLPPLLLSHYQSKEQLLSFIYSISLYKMDSRTLVLLLLFCLMFLHDASGVFPFLSLLYIYIYKYIAHVHIFLQLQCFLQISLTPMPMFMHFPFARFASQHLHTHAHIYIYHFCIVINTYAHADIYLVFGIYYSVHVFAMIHTKMVIDLADDGNEEG